VTAFFVFAYALSWLAWSLPALQVAEPLASIGYVAGGFGPAVAGAITAWLAGDSVRAWARDIVRWRVWPGWYGAAVVLAVLPVAVATLLVLPLGVSVDLGLLTDRLDELLPTFLMIALLGGGNEEPGWRGFALPRLEAQFHPVAATVLLGVVWGLWHLPLLAAEPGTLHGLASLADLAPMVGLTLLNIVGYAVLLTWVYNGSQSVLLAIVLHASFNTANALLVPIAASALAGDAYLSVLAATTGGVWLVAIGLILATRGQLGYADSESSVVG
jgi:membrane protease YdiL (CAAX protease family)